MLGLARAGNVILVGRGGNLVTKRLPNVVHARLVAPLAQRVRAVQNLHHCPQLEAAGFVAKTDRARARFLRQNFGARIEDSASYDLILNTGRLGFEKATGLIGDLVLGRMRDRGDTGGDEEVGVFAASRLTTS
jgi:cytidylate kinase